VVATRKVRLIRKIAKKLNLRDLEVTKRVDIVGHVAILKMPEALMEARFRLAQELLKETPSIKTVYRQISPVSGDYRLRELEWLAGEKRSITTYKEHGCLVEVDVQKDYFSPRLARERTIIATQVKNHELATGTGESIVNMFAGVGTFSLRIVKETTLSKIFSIDVNPGAFNRMFRNVLSNKMLNRIICVYGDATNLVESLLRRRADRILMPLPEKAIQYLEPALCALKNEGGVINLQNFVYAGKGTSPIDSSRTLLQTKLQSLDCDYEIEDERVIRSVGPGWYQVAHDVRAMPDRSKAPGKNLGSRF
jgi:tRNA (guanine37-N1)-methyltransferase